MKARETDFVGIGVGPANLSLAALAHPVPNLHGRFLDGKSEFQWHSGIMLPAAQLQVSYLKDLVTLVDPTSRYTFLNFLVEHGRIYRSLMANGTSCTRQEFEQYYRWVEAQIPGIDWGRRVKDVRLVDDRFEVNCEGGERTATRALVLGSGREPVVPSFAAVLHGDQVLHSSELLSVQPEVRGRRVMVVGGGQSGAEIVNHLLGDDANLPVSLSWVSSRIGFLPLDDSAFTNEWFAPAYVRHFHNLPARRRAELLSQQRLASDGVSDDLLSAIYRRLYQLDTIGGGRLRHHLLPCRRLTDLQRSGSSLVATLHDSDLGRAERHGADVVILCTGYRSSFPDYLEPLHSRIVDSSGVLRVRPDYSLDWDGPDRLRIYVQNFAEASHGIADPNLSLVAWRSARILNSLAGSEVYLIDRTASTLDWTWPLCDEELTLTAT